MAVKRRFDPLDLRDGSGRVSNQKLLPLVLFIAALVFQALKNPLSTSALVVLGALAFGPRMYALFIRRGAIPQESTLVTEVPPPAQAGTVSE